MILKLIVRYSTNKSPLSRLFQISTVVYKKDDVGVLCSSLLNKIGESFKEISHG